MNYELEDREEPNNLDDLHKKAEKKIKALENPQIKTKEVFEGWKDKKKNKKK
tara:strand:- start:60 stop:215 length:156 start_codon:yes stop_codon:yes gene_type:complete